MKEVHTHSTRKQWTYNLTCTWGRPHLHKLSVSFGRMCVSEKSWNGGPEISKNVASRDQQVLQSP